MTAKKQKAFCLKEFRGVNPEHIRMMEARGIASAERMLCRVLLSRQCAKRRGERPRGDVLSDVERHAVQPGLDRRSDDPYPIVQFLMLELLDDRRNDINSIAVYP